MQTKKSHFSFSPLPILHPLFPFRLRKSHSTADLLKKYHFNASPKNLNRIECFQKTRVQKLRAIFYFIIFVFCRAAISCDIKNRWKKRRERACVYVCVHAIFRINAAASSRSENGSEKPCQAIFMGNFSRRQCERLARGYTRILQSDAYIKHNAFKVQTNQQTNSKKANNMSK